MRERVNLPARPAGALVLDWTPAVPCTVFRLWYRADVAGTFTIQTAPAGAPGMAVTLTSTAAAAGTVYTYQGSGPVGALLVSFVPTAGAASAVEVAAEVGPWSD